MSKLSRNARAPMKLIPTRIQREAFNQYIVSVQCIIKGCWTVSPNKVKMNRIIQTNDISKFLIRIANCISKPIQLLLIKYFSNV